MRKKIIFFGDSIIKYNKNKLLVDWGDFLRKKIILNFPNKYTFYSKTIVGLNSTQGIKAFKNLYNNFKSNLLKIINKSNKIGIKEIFFISYHYLLNNRREINKMTLNQNLHKYIKLLKKICYREKVKFIDIFKHTKNINSKKLCRPMPDGVHLSLNGAQIYSKIIFKNMKKYL